MAAASAPPDTTERLSARNVRKAYCGAKTKSRQGTCELVAGFGTEHVGFGHCKFHGGAGRNGEKHAAKLLAAALALEYQIEPHEALLRAVGQAAKWELICRAKVDTLREEDLAAQHVRQRSWAGNGENGTGGGTETIEEAHHDLNVWVKAHVQAMRDLASIAKTAVDAGVEERRVRMVETLGGDLADLIGAVLAGLKLTPEQQQRAPEIVRTQLALIEGGAAA